MVPITGIIPAVSDYASLRTFLASPYPLCFLIHTHIADLESVYRHIREAGKDAAVHIDLVRGLSPDEFGAEYLCGRIRPAGVISTRPAVITACKKLGVTAILRCFLIDSAALDKSVAAIEKCRPDYVELLPALCTPIFPTLRSRLGIPLIAGGLIPNRKTAEKILTCGVDAVSISVKSLVDEK